MMGVSVTKYVVVLAICTVVLSAVQSKLAPQGYLCWKHKCPKGYVCKVTPIQCFRAPCPSGLPTCIKRIVTHPGKCPKLVPGRIGICLARCSSDAECGIGQKCCGNCPRQCTNVSVVVKPGRCPFNLDLPWSGSRSRFRRCGRPCSFDRDCSGDLKCCNAGSCGKMCLPPSRIYSNKDLTF
ncbi:perlwapin-like [Gigantopelta aegis]|uniref:perlwapin-like n=1 Tax=Gigantopelta aegis TaxID=1735272 RepID=UPI001B88C075|nr:perlwapin-like [Gigantopelta aegis]